MAKPATKTPAVPVAFDDIGTQSKGVSVLAEEIWRIGHCLATAPEGRDAERDEVIGAGVSPSAKQLHLAGTLSDSA
jgi:hypothetical protein